jgi:hypothetical protein
MKHLIVTLMLSVLAAACVGPNGVPAPQARNRGPQSTNQAPPPEPTTRGQSALMRKPPECASCNADVRRRLSNCGSVSSSCMAGCSGTDAMKTAICQSGCQSLYAQCAQVASMPNDCPAYCAL